MSDRLLQNCKFTSGWDPIADAWATSLATDVVSLADYKHANFLLHEGVGASGAAVITVQSCDNVTPDTKTAIAFRYKQMTTYDTEGDTTNATSSGFTTTVGGSNMYLIEVDDSELSGTDKYVRLLATESVNHPVISSCGILLTGAKWGGDDLRTTIE
jgi:hypothetical protein